jgi:hypothetical protein
MRRRGSKSERLALIAGVVLSAVLGVFFYIKTDVATAMATYAGLVGIVITLQVESALRERRLAEELTRQQRLVNRVESIGWLPDLLDQALNALDEIEREQAGTVAADLARKAFAAFLAQTRDLRRGRYSTTLESVAVVLVHELTERAQHTLRGTIPGSDNPEYLQWWQSVRGQAYWRGDLEALRRGVAIHRVFLYQTWNDQLAALIEAQRASGVHTLRVAVEKLPPTLRVNLSIWDEAAGLERRGNAVGDLIDSDYVFTPPDVKAMIERYTMIESYAEPWPTGT